jgi:hypothetical protein
MKTLALFFTLLFGAAVHSQVVAAPDFSKMTTVTIDESSKIDTAYDWKVDDWPADPNVHQVASYTTSSVFLESNGWNFIAECTTPVFITAPCKQIPAGVHDVEWKGKRVYRWQVMQGENTSEGTATEPASVTVIFQDGKKKRKVTYHIDSFNRCDGDGSSRTCVFFDSPLADMAD